MNKAKEIVKDFMYEEEGIAIVEIILILVLLVGLVVLFRKNILNAVKNIIDSIANDMGEVTKNYE